MRRLMLLIAAGSLWLFLAAVPVFADGGPHLKATNSGSSSLTADSCAGCHRAHSAQGQYLLAAANEEALCLSCHGQGVTGATTDVESGIQYVPTGTGERDATTTTKVITDIASGVLTTSTVHGLAVNDTVLIEGLSAKGIPNGTYNVATVPSTTTFTVAQTGLTITNGTGLTGEALYSTPVSPILGALRDGGFLSARIGTSNPTRTMYYRGWEDGPYNTEYAISTRPKVSVGTSAPVNSAHIDLFAGGKAGVASTGTQWGSGTSAIDGVGASVELSCADCHNPHGNGNYRILNPVPGPEGAQVALTVTNTYANSNTIVTATQHALAVNDAVTLTGVGGLTNGTYYVASVNNGFTFQVGATLGSSSALTLTDTSGGTVLRSPVAVADVSTTPSYGSYGSNPTKNYTILQIKGQQGVPGTFLLYAKDVTDARSTGTGVVAARVASITSVVSNWITATAATGFTVGDQVTIAGMDTQVPAGTYTVSSVQSNGTLYNQFKLAGVTAANGTGLTGTATRAALTGGSYDYSATAGDYFRRTVPWNPVLTNSNCNPAVVATTSTGASAAQIANSAYCGTMNDAPNGIPAAITSGTGKPTALVGQQAFVDQMSTWCTSCHTRYYQNSNQNPATSGPNSIAPTSALTTYIGTVSSAGVIAPSLFNGGTGATGFSFSSPSLGDQVTITGADANLNGTRWVIATSSSGFQVSATRGGAAITPTVAVTSMPTWPTNNGTITRVYQDSASGWGFPRNVSGTVDPTYKYQHSTASNRACTVCHVGHGSNATVTGQDGTTFSADEVYPDGTTTSTSSRLLKVNNRGTCQLCHDPTGTILVGTTQGAANTTIP